MPKTNDNDKIIKDAQYRKGLSIAFFNATNAAISLVSSQNINDKERGAVLKEVCEIRDFLLEEHKNYYATVIANVGANYDAKKSIEKLEATTSLETLQVAWIMLSADERKDDEIRKVAAKLRTKYEKA